MNEADQKMLADEIRAAADEFNRLAELASTKGMRVDAALLPLQKIGAIGPIPLLQVRVTRAI